MHRVPNRRTDPARRGILLRLPNPRCSDPLRRSRENYELDRKDDRKFQLYTLRSPYLSDKHEPTI